METDCFHVVQIFYLLTKQKFMKNLIKLYEINAPSLKTQKMKNHIINVLRTMDCLIRCKNGNIYATKGKSDDYPCIVAHMDEVHNPCRSKRIIVDVDNDLIFGFDTSTNDFTGIGADDKNGIWIALECIKRLDVCKVAIFRDEEIGCLGSLESDMMFFDDCRFVIQCDRRNSGDFITSIGFTELCDLSFYKYCDAAKYGYKICEGLMTDVQTLKELGLGVASCNLSCGYYNPHTKCEFTRFGELVNCLNLVLHICEKIQHPIVHHCFSPKKRFFW